MRIVLAEDHRIVREGIRLLLEREPDFKIVGECEDGLQTVEIVRSLCPDILVLDMMMPGINGMEVTLRVRKVSPQTHVIILSMYSYEGYVAEAFNNGAEGYVLKDSSGGDLIRAIREVVVGRRFLSSPISEVVLKDYVRAKESPSIDPLDTLTRRERDVLHMVSNGMSSAVIATRLSISPRTVEIHRANMMRKLSLQNQADLIRFAIQKNILPLEE